MTTVGPTKILHKVFSSCGSVEKALKEHLNLHAGNQHLQRIKLGLETEPSYFGTDLNALKTSITFLIL